jgi:hypothetical protein
MKGVSPSHTVTTHICKIHFHLVDSSRYKYCTPNYCMVFQSIARRGYSPWWTLPSFTTARHWSRSCHFRLHFGVSVRLQSWKTCQQLRLFTGWGLPTQRPMPNLEDQDILFCLDNHFDLSSMGDTTSSYATASIALRIIWPRKPHRYVKVGIPAGGDHGIAFTF